MSVKIVGVKKLDANVYDRMVIREIDGNYFVNVNGAKLSKDYVSGTYKLSDSLKGIKDTEKVILIVDSFLENMKIKSIDALVRCINYNGNFIEVDGTRKLHLQIENKELLKVIIKMIINKYNRDRYQYCINNSKDNEYNIFLNDKFTSYDKKFIDCKDCSYSTCDDKCPKNIEFRLMYINGKIAYFDKLFIERFIMDKLWEVGKDACIFVHEKDIKLLGGEKVGRYVDAYYILCGDLSIKFTCGVFNKDYIFSLCSEIVNKYNEELTINNSMMKRQLKMEEF